MTNHLTEEELNDLRGIAGFLDAEGMPNSADSILKLIDRLTAAAPPQMTGKLSGDNQ